MVFMTRGCANVIPRASWLEESLRFCAGAHRSISTRGHYIDLTGVVIHAVCARSMSTRTMQHIRTESKVFFQ
jgi:hypothetical protein